MRSTMDGWGGPVCPIKRFIWEPNSWAQRYCSKVVDTTWSSVSTQAQDDQEALDHLQVAKRTFLSLAISIYARTGDWPVRIQKLWDELLSPRKGRASLNKSTRWSRSVSRPQTGLSVLRDFWTWPKTRRCSAWWEIDTIYHDVIFWSFDEVGSARRAEKESPSIAASRQPRPP